MSGLQSYHAGLAAEDIAARIIERDGGQILERRWRCPAGEIDLIARSGGVILFVEVKTSKTLERAAQALGARQQARLHAAALGYVARNGLPLETEMRIDVILIDAQGRSELIKNAGLA